MRFLTRQLLLSCQRVLDAIDRLPLIDRELLVTCDNGAVERITPSQFFLFLTHRANDDLVSAARQHFESCDSETRDIVEHANHTHHAIFRRLKADQGGG
jgi:predicted Mrr-cat superfamily restriction endonuclease